MKSSTFGLGHTAQIGLCWEDYNDGPKSYDKFAFVVCWKGTHTHPLVLPTYNVNPCIRRLQHSPYYCMFKWRAVKRKVWNEAENRERDWGETLWECEARELRARKTLTPRFTDFFTDFEKKPDCFAVQCIRNCSHDSTLGNLSNDDGDSSTKMSLKKCSRAASNFIAIIPSRSICQMLAIFSGVEF